MVSWLGILLVQQNTMTKKQVWEERAYLAYTSILLFIIEGSQVRNQTGKEPEGPDSCRGHGLVLLTGWFTLTRSVCFLIETQDLKPRDSTISWNLSHQ